MTSVRLALAVLVVIVPMEALGQTSGAGLIEICSNQDRSRQMYCRGYVNGVAAALGERCGLAREGVGSIGDIPMLDLRRSDRDTSDVFLEVLSVDDFRELASELSAPAAVYLALMPYFFCG